MCKKRSFIEKFIKEQFKYERHFIVKEIKKMINSIIIFLKELLKIKNKAIIF